MPFVQISQVEAASLENSFSVEVIWEVVKEFDGKKCPGLEGYNFNFIHKCWNLLSGDILKFVVEFYYRANFPTAVSATFLALIPKVENP